MKSYYAITFSENDLDSGYIRVYDDLSKAKIQRDALKSGKVMKFTLEEVTDGSETNGNETRD